MVFSSPPATKPMRRLSGDQNGRLAPSAPSRRRDVIESRDRTHSCDSERVTPPMTNATIVPSGDTATPVESGYSCAPAGGSSENRSTPAAAVALAHGRNTANTSAALSTAAASPPIAYGGHLRRAVSAGSDRMLDADESGAPDAIFAIVTRASPMSRRRDFGSRSRQRSSSCRSRVGVFGGSALQSISCRSTAASTSDISSPSNARRPVTIS